MKFEKQIIPWDHELFDVTVTTGQNGWIEFLNYSNFIYILTIPGLGQTVLAAATRQIFPLPNPDMGSQTVYGSAIISRGLSPGPFFGSASSTCTPSQIIYVNSYQNQEIEWYAPIPLQLTPALNAGAIFTATGTGAGSATLPAPVPTPPLGIGINVVTGFDFNVGHNGAYTDGVLTTSGFFGNPAWQVSSNPTSVFNLMETFPQPLLGNQNSAQTWTVPALGSGPTPTWHLNIYYYQIFYPTGAL